ncbi:MAG TPA: HD-GYP domain-containing protein, partial [Desulfurivibrionaceae bacterium]|nr:HD-GYP domain-containing protein [Desulfurivibrionaceae bacterium]
MTPQEIETIRKISLLFKEHKDAILQNWLAIIHREGLSQDNIELEYFKYGFEKLLNDFIIHLDHGDLDAYYQGNREIARQISYNDISYEHFIEAFHLFEDSYMDVLSGAKEGKDVCGCLSAIDRLHHKTIAIVAQAFFEIHDNTVFALAKLAAMRDSGTGRHLERTREFATLLAKEVHPEGDFPHQMYRVGPLHDIGKTAISDAILLKEGPLTDDEYAAIKSHTLIGAEVIDRIVGSHKLNRGYLKMARDIVLYHHERYDGSGYPMGLHGEEIPLAARVFAVADVYDVITSDRPYKTGLPHAEAVARIESGSGSFFCPRVVTAFMKIHPAFEIVRDQF